MARIRTIKPEFFTSRSNAELPMSARLTFIGLWTYADDNGRGADDPRLVKAALWPLEDKHTAAKVEADLAALADAGKILRYEVDGDRWLQIVKWGDHQRINRPSKCVIPPPPDTTGSPQAHDTLTEPDVSSHPGKGREHGREHGTVVESSVSSDSPPVDDDEPRLTIDELRQRREQIRREQQEAS